MKKLLVVGMVLLFSFGSTLAGEMTADELIGKYVDAIGGEKTIRALENVYMAGSMFTQGMSFEMKMYTVMPDMGYMEASMNNMVMVAGGTNGKEAWQKTPMGTFILEGEMKERAGREADLFPLLDYKKRGATAKYLGEDLVKGKQAYKMEFIEGGDTAIYYFDAESHLEVKRKESGSTLSFTNYKEVGGVMFAYKVNASTPQGQQMVTLDTIAVNVDIPDSLFVMPKDAVPFPDLTPPDSADTSK